MATATQSALAAVREMRSRAIPRSVEAPSPGVVSALARVEARKMLRHPAYLVAFGLSILLFGGLRGSSFELAPLVLGLGAALVIGTLFAANLGALRSRRDGTDELFGSTPAPLAARTASQLAAVWIGPGSLSLLWTALVWVLYRADVSGFTDDLRSVMLVQTPFVIAAVGALGVATARWIPHVIGGAIVLALHMFTPLIWVIPWVVFREELALNLWHLGYLVSVTVAFSSAAFLRDRVRLAPAIGAMVGLVGAIAFGILHVPEGGF